MVEAHPEEVIEINVVGGNDARRPRSEHIPRPAGAFCREEENVEGQAIGYRGIGHDSRLRIKFHFVSAVTMTRFGVLSY